MNLFVKSALRKISLFSLLILVVSLSTPVVSYAMSTASFYFHNVGEYVSCSVYYSDGSCKKYVDIPANHPQHGNLTGHIYTKDPNSVTIHANYTNPNTVTTITYSTYGHLYNQEYYNDQNERYYSVFFDVYVGNMPSSVEVSDSETTHTQLVFQPLTPNYSFYDYYGDSSVRLSTKRMIGSQSFSTYLANSYLQPSASILTFTPTQSNSDTLMVQFPFSQTDFTKISTSALTLSDLSLNDLTAAGTPAVTISELHPSYYPYNDKRSSLIIRTSTNLLEGHSYALKMSSTSSGTEIRLPEASNYYTSINLGSLVAYTYDHHETEYEVNGKNSLYFDNYAISAPSTTSDSGTTEGGTAGSPPFMGFPTDSSIVTSPSPMPSSTPSPVVVETDTGVAVALEAKLTKLENGKTVSTVKLNSEALTSALNQLKAKAAKSQTITLDVGKNQSDISDISLPASAILSSSSIHSDTILNIKSNDVTYNLPIEIFASLSQSLAAGAENAEIHVTLEKVSGSNSVLLKNNAVAAGIDPQGEAIEFNIFIESNGKKQEIHDFGKIYVNRSLVIPTPLLNDTTTAVLYNPLSGQFTFVPSLIEAKDGKTLVTIKRNGNSQYLIVHSNKTFSDIENSFAKADIQLLASKLIVKGTSEDRFEPEANITRAQFTSLLVRALGLTIETEGGDSIFSDVHAFDWYDPSIQSAIKAGLINGFSDGTFRPNVPISREQMAGLIAKALDFAGKTVQIDSNSPLILDRFKDKSAISNWSSEAIIKVTQAEIMQGNSGSFDPQTYANRAQAVTTLKRLLQYLEFIN